jgi:hypothetical protein
MVVYRCDGCGRELPTGSLRYHVKIDVRAAYDKMEIGLAELVRDHRQEMLRLIERLEGKSSKELEETIYKHVEFDLCPSCQRAYLHAPLRFHPEEGEASPIDIDLFLRSLGYGKPDAGDAE